MFNTNNQENLKDKANQLNENVKANIDDVANDVRDSAERISNNFQQKTAETKNEATNVIASLKSLINQYTCSSNVADIKNKILDKAHELQDTVTDEVVHAYNVSRDRATQTVQEKPLLTLGLAVGAGVLLGYILGSKQSSR